MAEQLVAALGEAEHECHQGQLAQAVPLLPAAAQREVSGPSKLARPATSQDSQRAVRGPLTGK